MAKACNVGVSLGLHWSTTQTTTTTTKPLLNAFYFTYKTLYFLIYMYTFYFYL